MDLKEITKTMYLNSGMELNDMRYIMEVFSKEKGLNHYINDIKIDTYGCDTLGHYDETKKTITIYKNNIINNSNAVSKYLSLQNKECNANRLGNLMVMKVLLHELYHVEQAKIANEDNGFKGQLFRKCYDITRDKYLLYLICYSLMICEYHANMQALLYVNELDTKYANLVLDNAYNYYRNNYLIFSPYQKFNAFFKTELEVPDMDLYNDIIYGLPLNKDNKTKVLTLLKNGSVHINDNK